MSENILLRRLREEKINMINFKLRNEDPYEYWLDTLPLKSVFQQVLQGSGECAAVDWSLLGQSLPVWSGLFFAVLTLISLWQLFRRYPTSATK